MSLMVPPPPLNRLGDDGGEGGVWGEESFYSSHREYGHIVGAVIMVTKGGLCLLSKKNSLHFYTIRIRIYQEKC